VQQKLLDSLDARIANAQTRADEIAASGASLGTFGAATVRNVSYTMPGYLAK